MAYQPIDIGITSDDRKGDKLRTAGIKINSMFSELYSGYQIPLSGQFFSDSSPAATISRLGDRAFAGAAVSQDGAAVPAQRTWAGLEASGYMTYLDTRSTVESISTIASIAYAAASRTSDKPTGVDTVCMGYASLVKNDLNSATASDREGAWCFYGMAARAADSGSSIAGATQVAEFEIANLGGVVDVNPYLSRSMTSGVTYAAIFGAGGEYAESGATVNAATAAIHISGNNGGKFRKGISFTSNALDGADGTTGTGDAMSMALGHQLVWFFSGSDSARGLTIRSDCNDIAYAMKVVASTTGLRIYDQYENTVARFLPDTANTAAAASNNSLIFRNYKATTGNPSIQGTGSDTNVGVDLVGQNRAQFNIYNYAKVRLMARFADVGAATTSASNVLIFNATDAGAAPYIKAGGTDTNSSVGIEGKGTGGAVIRDGAAAKKFECNTTGLGFFAATPVGVQTLSAALSTGGAETNTNIATAINAIRTALINYGLAA